MIYSVITGDIVQSSRLEADMRQWLMQALKNALTRWNQSFEMESELVRGDSFQCLIGQPKLGLKIATLIRTYIKCLDPYSELDIYGFENPKISNTKGQVAPKFEVRIALGIGAIDYHGQTLAESDGEAFQLSGRALDLLKTGRSQLTIVSNDSYNPELASLSILLDAIISKTSSLQCEVINLKLLDFTETEIAKMLNIQQPAVNQRAHAGNWHAIKSAIKRYSEIYGE